MGTNSELSFYVTRFKTEEEAYADADRKANEWAEMRNRRQVKMKALLQLAAEAALEEKQPLPEDLMKKAVGLLGPQIHAMLKDLKAKGSEATNGRPAIPELANVLSEASYGDRQDGDGSGSLADFTPPGARDGQGTNRVQWIAEVVAASGNKGITPPEIMHKAVDTGLTMHKNYPYVVLGKLVERKVVRKDGGRYYKR